MTRRLAALAALTTALTIPAPATAGCTTKAASNGSRASTSARS